MTSDIELAIHHAFGLARSRGGRLASVTLQGPGDVVVIAAAVLARLAAVDVEVHHQAGTSVRLIAVEIVPAPP